MTYLLPSCRPWSGRRKAGPADLRPGPDVPLGGRDGVGGHVSHEQGHPRTVYVLQEVLPLQQGDRGRQLGELGAGDVRHLHIPERSRKAGMLSVRNCPNVRSNERKKIRIRIACRMSAQRCRFLVLGMPQLKFIFSSNCWLYRRHLNITFFNTCTCLLQWNHDRIGTIKFNTTKNSTTYRYQGIKPI